MHGVTAHVPHTIVTLLVQDDDVFTPPSSAGWHKGKKGDLRYFWRAPGNCCWIRAIDKFKTTHLRPNKGSFLPSGWMSVSRAAIRLLCCPFFVKKKSFSACLLSLFQPSYHLTASTTVLYIPPRSLFFCPPHFLSFVHCMLFVPIRITCPRWSFPLMLCLRPLLLIVKLPSPSHFLRSELLTRLRRRRIGRVWMAFVRFARLVAE